MRLSALMMVTVVVLMLAHVVEMAVWAGYYAWAGIETEKAGAFEFAFENYTALGYGDAVADAGFRLMGPITALNGLLLIGWSVAIIFEIVKMADVQIGSEKVPIDLSNFVPARCLSCGGRNVRSQMRHRHAMWVVMWVALAMALTLPLASPVEAANDKTKHKKPVAAHPIKHRHSAVAARQGYRGQNVVRPARFTTARTISATIPTRTSARRSCAIWAAATAATTDAGGSIFLAINPPSGAPAPVDGGRGPDG